MNARLAIFSKKNKKTQAQNQAIASEGIRILLVDDDIYIQEMNAGALIRAGYNVETADDGADAWQALNSRSYDLLIINNKMPRVTGLEVIKKLRAVDMKLPVILTPQKVPAEEFEPQLLVRFDATLAKPFTTSALLGMVEKILRATKNAAASARLLVHSKASHIPPTGKKGEVLTIETKFPARILMVDDEPLIRELFTELLNDQGYEVDAAKNGADAWDALRVKAYDLLITDIEMPQTSGIELVMKLRGAHMALPVIMVSGIFPREELTQHPELRIEATLHKPFTITEFTDTVKKVLHAADDVINSPQLFRDCAMVDNQMQPDKNPPSPPVRNQTNPSYRILVVDDDSDTREISMNVLSGSGYTVQGVTDGADGWEALQTSDYDLIVTDNKMPRMTGMEMITKLRAARMNLPVIMATGNLPLHEFKRRPWLKPDLMLQRPFSNDDLLTAVKKILRPDDGRDDIKESLLPKYL
jgi:DNA-binding response OmpR family regulator